MIHSGKELSTRLALPLHVLSVQPETLSVDEKGEALEYLYGLATREGAAMTIYYHDDSALIVAGYIKKYHVQHIVTGMQTPDQYGVGFVDVLRTLCPEVPISMVDEDGKMYQLSTSFPHARKLVLGART